MDSYERYFEQIDEPGGGDPFVHPEHGRICRACFFLALRVYPSGGRCDCKEGDPCPAQTKTT